VLRFAGGDELLAMYLERRMNELRDDSETSVNCNISIPRRNLFAEGRKSRLSDRTYSGCHCEGVWAIEEWRIALC